MPPTKSQKTFSGNKALRRNVASKVNLNEKVTSRSIAYAAVQVGFSLLHGFLCSSMATSSISTYKPRVHGPQYMKDLITGDCITMSWMSSKIHLGLLRRSAPKIYSTGGQGGSIPSACKGYSIDPQPDRKIFPGAAVRRQTNTSASRKAFKQQRAAREREEAS